MLTRSMDAILKKSEQIDAKLETLDEIKSKLDMLDDKYSELETRVSDVVKNVDDILFVEMQYKEAIRKTELSMSMNELHSKRMNIIVHNISQEEIWETRDQSLEKVRFCLENVLKIERAADIVIVDAHRLNVAQRNRNRPRPLIFKLLVMKDIRLKADNLKQLSTFNANLAKEKKFFVDLDHLPVNMQRDKMSLLNMFIKARKAHKNPKWQVDRSTGEFCLKIDDQIIKPLK